MKSKNLPNISYGLKMKIKNNYLKQHEMDMNHSKISESESAAIRYDFTELHRTAAVDENEN